MKVNGHYIIKDNKVIFNNANENEINKSIKLKVINGKNEDQIEYKGNIFSNSKKNILVIDDEPLMLMSWIIFFHEYRNKYNIITVNNPADGLDIISNMAKKINLILLDLMMPEISGLSVLNEIRNNPLSNHIPVIIQSAAINEFVTDSVKNIANDIIHKPIDKKLALEIVKQHIL